jgi:hypothetical protein
VAYGQTDGATQGTLTIKALFNSGQFPLQGIVEIYPEGRGKLQEVAIDGEASVRLPYGGYQIRLVTPDFTPVARNITIDRPDTLVVLSRASTDLVGNFVPQPIAMQVRVRSAVPCNSGDFLWVKLVGIYSDYLDERRLQPDGTVRFEALGSGYYAVMIVDSTQVRAVSTVKAVARETVVDLTLDACPAVEPAK